MISENEILIDGPQALVVAHHCEGDHPEGESRFCDLAYKSLNRPCNTCGGMGWDYEGGHLNCNTCGGTGRHTFTVQVEHAGPWSSVTQEYAPRTLTVHVIDVLAIYGEDHEHYDAEWVEIVNGTAHRFWWDGIRSAHTSEPITLPSAAEPGKWLVRLAVHS